MPAARGYTTNYKWDRNFFLLYVVLIWIGIAMGFGTEIVKHIRNHAPPYALIVHFHAAAFVGWLVLLTVQVLLIRVHPRWRLCISPMTYWHSVSAATIWRRAGGFIRHTSRVLLGCSPTN